MSKTKKLIMLTGPMGVGKTTTGKLLCDKFGKTAFIDGDWCMDIHPFVGNAETINMAVENIIFMIKNYCRCSICENVVLSWIMSERTIGKIRNNLAEEGLDISTVTITCDESALTERWKKDTVTEWRVDEWLEISLASIGDYGNRNDSIIIDTSDLQPNDVADNIIERLFVEK